MPHGIGREFGHHRPDSVLDARDIRQKEQAVRLERAGNGTCRSVAIHVHRVTRPPDAKRSDDGDHFRLEQGFEHLCIDLGGRSNETQLWIGLIAKHQISVLAGNPDGAAALGVDGLNNALVDEAREHRLDHLDRGFVRHALAAYELGRDALFREHLVDHRSAAVDHDRVHADQPHQHDVAGKTGHGLVIAHGVAAKFNDDGGSVVALKHRQRIVQCCGSGRPVPFHEILRLHWLTYRGAASLTICRRALKPVSR